MVDPVFVSEPSSAAVTSAVLISPYEQTIKTSLGAKDFLLSKPSGVYTVLRCTAQAQFILADFHIQRLLSGLPEGADLEKENERFDRFLRHCPDEYHKLFPKNDDIELKITLLLVNVDKKSLLYGHVEPFQLKDIQSCQVIVAGNKPRDTAHLKSSTWVSERASLEKLFMKPPIHEIILKDTIGNVYEGTQTNFFILLQQGTEYKIVTAPFGTVLHGSIQTVLEYVCLEIGLEMEYRLFNVDDLKKRKSGGYTVAGAFLTSTSRLVLPIDRIHFDDFSPSVSFPDIATLPIIKTLQTKLRNELSSISSEIDNISSNIKPSYERIKDKINKTPVFTSSTLDKMCSGKEERKIFFKAEIFQKVGAFKFRGASNAVMLLSDHAAKNGVITHSSGNHAQALSLAARNQGIPCYVVMPSNSPQVKKEAVIGYGAKVYECEPTLLARETTCNKLMEETGATFIHPYNDVNVISGQGTLGLEFIKQIHDDFSTSLDCIILPIGGGGLISGCSIAIKKFSPRTRIFGAEPKTVDDAAKSLNCGHVVKPVSPVKSIADGLLTGLGSKTWPVIKKNVEHIYTVSEKEISDAMRLVWERMKLVIEPSAAVCVAVCLYNEEFKSLEGMKRIGVVLEGGNVDLMNLPWKK